MHYDLSVIVPGIRTHNWKQLYDSISEATSRSWEMIFVGPYQLPDELINKSNVTYVHMWGTPMKAQQMGLLLAQGEYLTWAADDGYFLIGTLDTAFDLLNTEGTKDKKDILLGKYYEGENATDHVGMAGDNYYRLKWHECNRDLPGMPEDAPLLNVGLINVKYCKELGGWDAEKFEVCPLAYNDFAIRAYKDGANFIIQDEVMFKCTHMPGHEGDHGPIHNAQTLSDDFIFRNIYRQVNDRVVIDVNNWSNSPTVWPRRFKQHEQTVSCL